MTNLFLQCYVSALQCGDKNYKTVIRKPLTWHWWECLECVLLEFIVHNNKSVVSATFILAVSPKQSAVSMFNSKVNMLNMKPSTVYVNLCSNGFTVSTC